MSQVMKLQLKENPQRIICLNENGKLATVYEGGEIEYKQTILKGTTAYYDIQGVVENFTLFTANLPKSFSQSNLAILCVEFGYKQCEKGENIESAIINYHKTVNP